MKTEDDAESSIGSHSYFTEDWSSRGSTPRPPELHPTVKEELEPEAGDEYAKVVHPTPLACTMTHIVRSSANETRSATPDIGEGEYVSRAICTLSFFSLTYA